MDLELTARKWENKDPRGLLQTFSQVRGGGSVKIKLKIKSNIQSKIKSISGVIMIKIKLKSKNFEKLQRFSAFSTKSEKIRENLIEISEIATKFEKNANFSESY